MLRSSSSRRCVGPTATDQRAVVDRSTLAARIRATTSRSTRSARASEDHHVHHDSAAILSRSNSSADTSTLGELLSARGLVSGEVTAAGWLWPPPPGGVSLTLVLP